ncbi:MAG: hypothetical protein GY856_52915 [bacterium]|nr:hypothetical protein [bacterium]
MNQRRSRAVDYLLYGLLSATIIVPLLAVLPGTKAGQVVFTLYREPKLSAVQILGWTLLILVLWLRRRSFTAGSVATTLRQPLFIALTAFILYAAITALWVLVPENLFYELNQYFFILVFLAVLDAWARRDESVTAVVFYSLVFSLAPLTLVGFTQLAVEIPFLRSIDPGYGVQNASFMGYKNPMAQALLGHFFLLLYLTWRSFREGRGPAVKLALSGYALAELVYLVLLQSRSVYAALLVSSTVVAGVLLSGVRRVGHLVTAAAAAIGLGAFLWLLLLVNPAVKARFESLTDYLVDPHAYLHSDRGIYLRNTLNMAKHHPLGVGLGDWQTHYPVYRRHHRDVAFTDAFQVRRAHSDHVQFLGELGYPGLALWLTLLVTALLRPIRHFIRSGRVSSLFLAVQLLAFMVAMATDYVLELPFHKFQFFLVCALAGMTCRSPAQVAPVESRGRGYLATGMVAALTMLGLANIGYYSQLLAKNYHTAMLTVSYLETIDDGAGAGARIASTESWGRRSEALAGHAKTFYKSYLLRAHVAFLQGKIPRAVELTRESLRLHPHHPNSFRLLSEILGDGAPEKAAQYRNIYHYIMNGASEGFLIRYPAFLARSADRSSASTSGKAEEWAAMLGGRTVGSGTAAPVPRGAVTKYLYLCSDGRFYSEAKGPEGPAIDFGWWRVRTLGEEVLGELTFAGGEVAIYSLSGSGGALLVDGREVSLSERNEVCR